MRKFFAMIFWVILAIVVAYVSYTIYDKWFSGDVKQAVSTLDQNGTLTDAKGKALSLKDQAIQQGTELWDTLKTKAEEIKTSVFGSSAVSDLKDKAETAKDAVLNSDTVKKVVGEAEKIGGALSGGSADYSEPPVARMITKIGTAISFSLVSKGESTYTVDWGDGKSEKGTMGKTEQKSILHTWNTKGTYVAKIEIFEGEKSVYSETFPIEIVK